MRFVLVLEGATRALQSLPQGPPRRVGLPIAELEAGETSLGKLARPREAGIHRVGAQGTPNQLVAGQALVTVASPVGTLRVATTGATSGIRAMGAVRIPVAMARLGQGGGPNEMTADETIAGGTSVVRATLAAQETMEDGMADRPRHEVGIHGIPVATIAVRDAGRLRIAASGVQTRAIENRGRLEVVLAMQVANMGKETGVGIAKPAVAARPVLRGAGIRAGTQIEVRSAVASQVGRIEISDQADHNRESPGERDHATKDHLGRRVTDEQVGRAAQRGVTIIGLAGWKVELPAVIRRGPYPEMEVARGAQSNRGHLNHRPIGFLARLPIRFRAVGSRRGPSIIAALQLGSPGSEAVSAHVRASGGARCRETRRMVANGVAPKASSHGSSASSVQARMPTATHEGLHLRGAIRVLQTSNLGPTSERVNNSGSGPARPGCLSPGWSGSGWPGLWTVQMAPPGDAKSSELRATR